MTIVCVEDLALRLTEDKLFEALHSQEPIRLDFNDDKRARGNALITSIQPAKERQGFSWTVQFTIPEQPDICFEFDFGVPPRRP